MTATITPFPVRTPDPVAHAGLAELLQLGLAVARVVSHLAEMEDSTLQALAAGAADAARAALAPQPTYGDSLEAGRTADAYDAARDAIAARVASIVECFDKAARAVRRTALLQARLADARPFRQAPPPGREPPSHPVSIAAHRSAALDPASDAERPDTLDQGDELGNEPEAALAGIRRDLSRAARAARAAAALAPPGAAPEAPSAAPDAPPAPSPAPGPVPSRGSAPSLPNPPPEPDS